ncbi:L-ribulose-5-phosphate 4-epimerase [Nesterenkonia jeotgali]|uniref:L-ribulose-5-phosphate 4-epimerase n=1 Tax=Nesterenkonia jeotgali TaxID=317018 RepID=A0A0W8II36_9MICC|nr:L-ribulose-5-phosphate 4-epimerase [Nesterenkonia jeotgali]KUG59629.1 L-ribulose-5-phosphate 4-epimerase [Nesterenkonia jeotgali]
MNALHLKDLSASAQEAIAAARETVAGLHAELPRNDLVAWTAGNVSARVELADHEEVGPDGLSAVFVIKPSGVSYDELNASNMVVCTLDGVKIDDDTSIGLSPSSDTAAHAYVYRHMSHVGGVVHTHSSYATSWAARGESIPCVLTMMADEFGGDIPIGPFALIGDDSIGRGIVQTLQASRSKAVLMDRHGPFTIGADAKEAVKAAVLCEEVARTVHFARAYGNPERIAQHQIDALYARYQNVYGQKDNT